MTREEAIRAFEPIVDNEAYTDRFKDACRLAIEALQKQLPKKPKEYEDEYYVCPVCGNILMYKWLVYPEKLMPKGNGLPCCLKCLQAIDWSEE